MLRTKAVKLTVIPAMAYRVKSPKGINITVQRADKQQPGIASISRTSGEAVPTDNTDLKAYPLKAFKEAIELTNGLPYKNQKGVKVTKEMVAEKKEKVKEEVVVDPKEYGKIVEKYSDKSGKFSYDLINKDFIKFAKTSKVVGDLLADGATLAKLRNYIVSTKFRNITGNHNLTDKQIKAMTELLDENYPKGVFKDLSGELRKLVGANKKK
ncbi:MAG: hypothetical protein IJI77_06755 [Erysipelotrichaceae bacterium]|nr:hypothetical protein [Erysipelotrichaceae bacterium]